MPDKKQVRVRFAPSPTGFVHIGNLRTVLYGYLIAKKYNGTFILRLEDTDQKRLVEGAVEKIIEALSWAGINIDEGVMGVDDKGVIIQHGDHGPYIQSQRLEIYQKYVQDLVQKGFAYPCFCTPDRLDEVRKQQQKSGQAPMYDKHCRSIKPDDSLKRIANGEKHVIRMAVPADEIIQFKDNVFGTIKIPTNTIDDQVLLKSDGFPTYHLAVVVDDHLMQISHITRGEEWLPSVPKHVLLYRFFGWDMPDMFHFPNVLGENKKKLSKRQGDVSVEDFIKKGYLPEAIVNFLALLGWNPKSEQEIFSLQELIEKFDEHEIHKAGAVFDYKKLDWMNSHYIRQKTDQELLGLCLPYFRKYFQGREVDEEILLKIVHIEKERIRKLSDITENIDFYFDEPRYDVMLLLWKKMTAEDAKVGLEKARQVLDSIDGKDYTVEHLMEKLMAAAGEKRGEMLWPLRVALSGKDKSPSPFEISWTIGKGETIKRIDAALSRLKQ